MYAGNVDIYYFFIIKCVKLLSEQGVCVMITPNSWLYTKSAHKLREFLFTHKYVREIIDFNSQKVFSGVSTYCCITVLDRTGKSHLVYNGIQFEYDRIMVNLDNIFETNILRENQVKLHDVCIISNGIATLCDKVYIHDHRLYDESCWKSIYCGHGNYKWAIYPYDAQGIPIPENTLRTTCPLTYGFLVDNRDLLNARDKGKGTYPTWYSYGRTQAVKIPPNKTVIFMSLFADPRNVDIKVCDSSLYKNSICIYYRDMSDNYDKIIDCITSNMDLIERKSAKRGGGWINISTTTIKDLVL
jgi:hypothetical protein